LRAWSLSQKLHKRRGEISLFRRIFTPPLTKNYSFWIKMSTRIKRLSFEMLYCKGKSKNEEFRKESIGKQVAVLGNHILLAT
jgi:hypothetical protein